MKSRRRLVRRLFSLWRRADPRSFVGKNGGSTFQQLSPLAISLRVKEARKIRLFDYANFTQQRRLKFEIGNPKLRLTKTLRFWVECALDDLKQRNAVGKKTQPIASILREFEEAGDAMRYVNADGHVAWKATSEMLSRLADAEQDAQDDLAD